MQRVGHTDSRQKDTNHVGLSVTFSLNLLVLIVVVLIEVGAE